MTRRPYHRPPEGRNRDHLDRDRVVDVLLARLVRGALSPAEAALLAEHVREYRRLAEENRRAMVGTTRALAKHREAADAAIVEAEQRATEAEQRAKAAEAALDRVCTLAHRMRAGSPQGAAAIYADRIEQALAADQPAEDDARRALVEAGIRARILDRADSTEARLAEQQREHDVALATERRNVVQASREAREQKRRADQAEVALARVRALLPTEPRPTRELPNGLAYEQGRHDAFDAVREALGEHQHAPAH